MREQFARANQRDYAGADEFWSDDVELVVPGPFLNAGVFHGRREVGRWFLDWFRTFSDAPDFDVREAEEGRAGLVAVVAHQRARGSASGVEIEADYFYVYSVRDGKISRLEFCPSREAARAAAGLGDA